MKRWVDISFDCLPLRSVGRLDVPLDASPEYQALCKRIKAAIRQHGLHNTYYLFNAKCVYHLTNSEDLGTLVFKFEGVALTDSDDAKTERSDLQVDLLRETCQWLTEPVVAWFATTVSKSVETEFDRYIAAGDLEQAKQRIEQIQAASDDAEGFVGMYL
jgi:hypothetical protein